MPFEFSSFQHMNINSRLAAPLASALMLTTFAFAAESSNVPAKAPKPSQEVWLNLFDGKTLSGWDGLKAHWTARDGVIAGTTTTGNALKGNTFLVWTNGTVANFELHFSYRIIPGDSQGFGNSGVQYRSKLMDPVNFVVGGYQADFEAGSTYSGILYEERGRGILAERGQRTHITEENGQTKIVKVGQLASSAELQANIHKEDWNEYTVIANGNHLMHFINNRMTVDVVDDQPSKAATEGILALQLHAGPPMLVEFRNIRLKRSP